MKGVPKPIAPIPPPRSTRANDPSVMLGIIQAVLGLFLFLSLLVLPIVGAIAGIGDDNAVTTSATDTTTQVSAFGLFLTTLIFQFVQGSYPAISSIRRDSTIRRDWRFAVSLPGDIGIGFLMALGCLIGAQITTLLFGKLVGLSDTDDASNTDVLTDNEGSLWLIGIVVLVVIGAPIAEELLFRGYLLRVLEKPFGSIFAIIVSSLLFAVPHWQPGASWQETTVLLSALATVGLVLAVGAVKTNRLGPPIIAHLLFNTVGTIVTLM